VARWPHPSPRWRSPGTPTGRWAASAIWTPSAPAQVGAWFGPADIPQTTWTGREIQNVGFFGFFSLFSPFPFFCPSPRLFSFVLHLCYSFSRSSFAFCSPLPLHRFFPMILEGPSRRGPLRSGSLPLMCPNEVVWGRLLVLWSDLGPSNPGHRAHHRREDIYQIRPPRLRDQDSSGSVLVGRTVADRQ